MTLWIRDPKAIYADRAERGLIIDADRIIECVPANCEPGTTVDTAFDASAHVILPGLINAHHHFCQTLTRAYGPALDKELFDWLTTLYDVWARMTPHDFRLATRVALCELLLSGCTCTSDHQYCFPAGLEHAIDIQIEEARKLGIRVCLTRGSMNLSQRDGGLPPQSVVQTDDVILKDSQRLIEQYHDPSKGAMFNIMLAPCSPFTVTESLMRETAKLAEHYQVRLHTHLAETHDETQFCIDRFGCRPLDYLDDTGWMHDRVYLAHGIHFDDHEIERLGKAKIGIAHCPSSNMRLASGFCRTQTLEQAGCPIGLAVDGSASNDHSNLVAERRAAFLLNRVSPHRYHITHHDVIRWATQGSARCLGRTDLGTLAPGQQADLAMFKLDGLRFSGQGDPIAALILCAAQRADRVMVAGRWRVIDSRIPNLDLAKLQHDHQQAANAIQTSTQ